jgi:hypothetical protein
MVRKQKLKADRLFPQGLVKGLSGMVREQNLRWKQTRPFRSWECRHLVTCTTPVASSPIVARGASNSDTVGALVGVAKAGAKAGVSTTLQHTKATSHSNTKVTICPSPILNIGEGPTSPEPNAQEGREDGAQQVEVAEALPKHLVPDFYSLSHNKEVLCHRQGSPVGGRLSLFLDFW